jgi:hypothetical protein
MSLRWSVVLAALVAFGFTVAVIVGAHGNQPLATPSSVTPVPKPVPTFDHIYLIVMENEAASSVVGSSNAPYINQLAQSYGLATNYTAVAHPSQPNYIAFWSGSTQGVKDDRVHRLVAPHLGDQLEAAGKSWKVYSENVPIADANGSAICFTGATATDGPDGNGTYARKHNPAISFVNVGNDIARCESHITDFSHFDPSAANVELIIPNLCHDMHDCSVKSGDDWLRTWLPSHILDTAAWKDSNSALFITWDEGSGNSSGGGKVATIVISKSMPRGFTSNTPHDHYSLLRTIEEAMGLGCLKESCRANTLGEFFP